MLPGANTRNKKLTYLNKKGQIRAWHPSVCAPAWLPVAPRKGSKLSTPSGPSPTALLHCPSPSPLSRPHVCLHSPSASPAGPPSSSSSCLCHLLPLMWTLGNASSALCSCLTDWELAFLSTLSIYSAVLCSVVSDCATLWTVVHQATLSVGFSRQEHWSRLPFPPPGDLPDPGIEPTSSALAGRFFCQSHLGAGTA